jgi:HKD family nuclease
MADELVEDEITTLNGKQQFNIIIKAAIDNILTGLRDRFKSMETIAITFSFLDGKTLFRMSLSDIKKHAIDLCNKYEKDLNKTEFLYEIESFKEHLFVLNDALKYGNSFEI